MGSSLSFAALASLACISSVGVGGNVPVDTTVFLGLSHPVSLVPAYTYFCRFYTRFSSISSHLPVYLVDIRFIGWLSGTSRVLINLYLKSPQAYIIGFIPLRLLGR